MRPHEQYDYLTKVRGMLFEWIRQLGVDQYAREFPYGLKTIHATLTHTAGSEWTNARRIQGASPTAADSPFAGNRTRTFAEVASAWTAQAPETRAALAAVSNWTDPVEFRLTLPNQPVVRIRTTKGGVASQLLFHEIHHRAQIMSMLRQHGIAAQNLDFSATMYHRTPE
jgi:uncharacterized damage-inducible protein DinB